MTALKHIEGNLGNMIVIASGAIIGIAVLDALSAWVELKYPNPATAGYLKLRNIRFAVSGTTATKKGA